MNRIIGTASLHLGDCIEVLRSMAENSVDSIVTDPPYGLNFMGKKWDYDVPSVEIWSECLRVLKPGGSLLAFAGTRTQHRMACRIEDAGFEIRDMIAWVYASGFPKSHNLDNLRGDKICGCAEPYTQNGAKQKTKCDVRSLRESDVSATVNTGKERREILQPSLQEQGAPIAGRAQLPATEDGGGQPSLEGWGDTPEAAGQLRAGALHASAGLGCSDGASGRVRDGAPAGDGGMVRIPADADGGGAPRGPRPAPQCQGEPGALAGQPEPQAMGAWPICGGCGLPMVPRGLGTALKPALEPITMARKPLVGTVAANVLAHGTGALNIDGCRVAVSADDDIHAKNPNTKGGFGHAGASVYGASEGAPAYDPSAGRWPANLIHDGSSDVVAAFPDSNGSGPARKLNRSAKPEQQGWGMNTTASDVASLRDAGTGSAARFFMQCKGDYNDAWQDLNLPQENANTAEQSSSQQRQAAVSALVLAVSSALPEGLLCSGLSMAPFTSATANELRLIAETATQTIQTIGSKFWRESKPARLSLSLNHASDAEIQRLTDTTTITVSRWKSDGSAEPVTFSITPMSLEVGGKDCAPSMDGKRFMYCAKASKADREEGLDGAPDRVLAMSNQAKAELARGNMHEGESGMNTAKVRKNHHPTVKPTDLMAYLVRLVTPPGGIVLDPFMGSGSTGRAAGIEQFKFIGIEVNPEYFEIACLRIDSATAQQGLEFA